MFFKYDINKHLMNVETLAIDILICDTNIIIKLTPKLQHSH